MARRENALGLANGTVEVVPYDSRWAGLYRETEAELRARLGDAILGVHHVGSTAVPGLCAKPILDVLVSVEDLEASRALVPAIESLGYEFRPHEDIPDRHFFRRKIAGGRTHHLSLAEPGSRHHRETITFRDALLADPELAAQYARLKLDLARRFPRDRAAYIEGKTAFVRGVIARSIP